ncbi:MAG: nucleoside deaminase [Desulfobulbaceae bacterium]|nr:nucleoside deaminase [Desulfobulbaceae bacterium]
MTEAIRLSVAKMQAGEGGPFGAVVVRRGEIVARGWNQVTSTNDPTAHAEMVAIREACRVLGTFWLGDCEIYSNCEPCPMCLSAIYWAGIPKLYYAATAADAATVGFADAYIYRELLSQPAERNLSMEQGMRGEALAAFKLWEEKADKVEY